jgi:hypothetical protein
MKKPPIYYLIFVLLLAVSTVSLSAGVRRYLRQQTPAGAAAAPAAQPAVKQVFIHQLHATQLMLDCSTCHQSEKPNSVEFARPGHEQCMGCHEDAFTKDLNQTICSQCHSAFPPTSSDDLLPFPRYAKKRALLFDFSHQKHVDSRGRKDAKTGFRADCTFCHKFDAEGQYASFPRHSECASCHSSGEIQPKLSAGSETKDCRGCHTPEEIENPGFTKERRLIADHVVSGVHVNLKFAHIPHFRNKERFNIDCTTCHYAVPQSTGLADLTLPKMLDCVQCHDTAKDMPQQFQMTNCQNCHVDGQKGSAPSSHVRNIKPPFHNESFRQHHEREATAPDAKCFVCHTNVRPPAAAALAGAPSDANQCVSCHQVMRPASHTARWRDDVHGKEAALDRATCATCHQAETCVRCHNETPRSHQPLAFFAAGSHKVPAMLDQRSCMTCHTFENTCSRCHLKKL